MLFDAPPHATLIASAPAIGPFPEYWYNMMISDHLDRPPRIHHIFRARKKQADVPVSASDAGL